MQWTDRFNHHHNHLPFSTSHDHGKIELPARIRLFIDFPCATGRYQNLDRRRRGHLGHRRKRGQGVGVRLGVKTTGCSGLAYKLEYVDEFAPEDLIFEDHGVKVLIDPKSLSYLDGTELDFVREGLNEGFKFNNPKERDRCGCGESFRV